MGIPAESAPGVIEYVRVRVLVVEDSERLVEVLTAGLRRGGHAVHAVTDVSGANAALATTHFDAAVVDVGLPDGSGLDWCRSARARGHDVPVLLLTARNALVDRITGLDAGADDYLAKPFAMDELLARLRALARRGPRWTESVRRFGALVIDRDRRTVVNDGTRFPFTAREFEIVSLLAWRDGRVASRDEIVEAVWGTSSDQAMASFDVLLARVRRKLAARGLGDAVRTVRGVGYAWGLEVSKRA